MSVISSVARNLVFHNRNTRSLTLFEMTNKTQTGKDDKEYLQFEYSEVGGVVDFFWHIVVRAREDDLGDFSDASNIFAV